MTPQFVEQSKIAESHGTQLVEAHLTESQFGEIFVGASMSAPSAVEAHLLLCEQCAAELAAMRESLSVFRQASSAYAEAELRRLPQIAVRRCAAPFFDPAYMVAAAALFLAALLPMQALHRFVSQPAPAMETVAAVQPTESDRALLEDVDREASLSVPAAMQSLADPSTDGAAVQTPTQRKD